MKLATISALATVAVSAIARLATGVSFRTGVTSRGSCGENDARLLWYASGCLPNEACANTPGVTGYTHEIICLNDYESHAQATFKSASSYVLVQVYKETNCGGDLFFAFAIIPDGTCYPTRYGAGYDGYSASIGADDSVTIKKYRDYPACSLQNFKAQNKAAEADGQTCLRNMDYADGDVAHKLTVIPAFMVSTTSPPTTRPTTTTTTTGAGSSSSASSTGSNSTKTTTAPPDRGTSSTVGLDPISSASSASRDTSTSPPKSAASDDSKSSSTASSSQSIVYIGAGAGGLLVVVVLVVIWMCCQRKNARKTPARLAEYASVGDGLGNHGSYFPSVAHSLVEPVTGGVSTDRRATTTARTTNRAAAHTQLLNTPTTGLWMDRDIQNSRINLADITIGEELSRGGFGIVSRGTYQGQPVAVKRLLPARSQNMKETESFLGEAKLLSKMKHPRIIQMVGVAWTSPRDLALVIEFMDGGDLRGLLANYEAQGQRSGFTVTKLKIALHVIEAVSYLHGFHPMVVHRDLKSKNILLSAQLDAKITDFGISRERAQDMTVGVGSWLWMAPEVLRKKPYDEKADVFSFGVVLSELDTHQLPYTKARGLPQMDILNGVADGSLLVDFTGKSGDREVVALARQCMALNPQDRPTAKQVHRRLQSISKTYRV